MTATITQTRPVMLRGVYIENTDYSTIIQRWDGPETVFYVDPPYIAETRASGLRGYTNEMCDVQHRELAAILNQVQGHVVLSGYDSDLYKELYYGWRRQERKTVADKAKRVTEVLWISPNTPEKELSLFSLHTF